MDKIEGEQPNCNDLNTFLLVLAVASYWQGCGHHQKQILSIAPTTPPTTTTTIPSTYRQHPLQ
jgi:hypothetical protein